MGNPLEKLANGFMKLAKFFVKLAIFCVVIYILGIRLFNFGHRLFYEKAMNPDNPTEVTFEISEGDNTSRIAKNLKNAGLIDDELAFVFRAKIYKTNFKPNMYSLKTNMTIKNILDIFDNPTSDAIIKVPQDVYELPAEHDEEE